MSEQIIEIDGSKHEGGGSILRVATALATITGKSIRVFNIRQNRPKGGGLGIQHLKGLEAITELCNGRIENAEIGSKEIRFYPGKIESKNLHIKIETAGSIILVLQTLIAPALFAPKPITISFEGGATDTFFSPTIDYFRYCFLKILTKMTENSSPPVEINVIRRGYYPEGGAKVEVKIYPVKLKKINPAPFLKYQKWCGVNLIERGNLKKILIISGSSEFLKNKKVAERQLMGTREILGKLNLPIEERTEYYQTRSPGSQVCLIGEFENTVIGVDNLGKMGKRAEDVGKEAALELLKEQKSNACLDKHLSDQILPYLALASGKSQVIVSEITEHCKTNAWVIEKFLEGEFKIDDNLISWTPKII